MNDNKRMCQVKNRSASYVCYRIPEDGIRREFAPGETRQVSFEELEKLSFQRGGREMMAQFLQIREEQAIEDFGIQTEPEYFMTEAEIIELLKNGTQDAFLDCLDFAPVGVIELVKAYAVSLPLENSAKREALKLKTGFDVEAAIKNIKADKEDEVVEAPTRRVQAETATAGRRTSGNNYKIIKTAE